VPDTCTGVPITEGDVLAPSDPAAGPCLGLGFPQYGPLPPPETSITAGALGLPLYTGCVGHPPLIPCGVEVDALSYGFDGLLLPIDYFTNPFPGHPGKGKLVFSVDRCAMGFGGVPIPPNLSTEWPPPPLSEAAADAFQDVGLPLSIFAIPGVIPWPAIPPVFGNTAAIDGNGLVSMPTAFPSGFSYPGLGLVEISPFFPPFPFYDNLDALDVEGFLPPVGFPATGVYFSLAGPIPDFCTGAPGNFSSGLNGPFVSADVLFTPAPFAPPFVYAPAPILGLDFFGPETDDLDALALVENGAPGWQPSVFPFDWTAAGGPDMLLFSVRRGSAVVGLPDSSSGIPIEPGDVLSTPSFVFSPFPSIIVPAEVLGLTTARSGVPTGPAGPDDMDALDIRRNAPPLFAWGVCFCTTGQGPCGNDDPTAGCVNSTGAGGLLRPNGPPGPGSSSVTLDNLVLNATQLPPFQQGLFYMGNVIVKAPFFDGIQCALGTTFRFLGSIQNTGAVGTMTMGPGIAGASGGLIVPGTTWIFQAWHRDVPGSPCLAFANLTNGVGVCFTP
jgi:hypothetical protein